MSVKDFLDAPKPFMKANLVLPLLGRSKDVAIGKGANAKTVGNSGAFWMTLVKSTSATCFDMMGKPLALYRLEDGRPNDPTRSRVIGATTRTTRCTRSSSTTKRSTCSRRR